MNDDMSPIAVYLFQNVSCENMIANGSL